MCVEMNSSLGKNLHQFTRANNDGGNPIHIQFPLKYLSIATLNSRSEFEQIMVPSMHKTTDFPYNCR